MITNLLVDVIPWHEQIVGWLYGGVIAVLSTISIFAIRDGYIRLTMLENMKIDHEKLLLRLDLTFQHIDEKLGNLLIEFGEHKKREFERDRTNDN